MSTTAPDCRSTLHQAPSQHGEARVAVLIPSKNGAATIAESIAAATPQAEVFVVDDGSTDATSAVAEASGAHVLRLEKNIGKARATRTILDHRWDALSGCRIPEAFSHICIVDDDVVIDRGFVAGALAAARRRRVVAVEAWSVSSWPRALRWNPWVATRSFATLRVQMTMVPLQSIVGTRTWLVGSHVLYQADVLDRVARSDRVFATEDCDYLWQIQRERLGSVRFTHRARAQLQHAQNWADLERQHLRWARGSWQVAFHNRLGSKRSRHDLWFGLTLLDVAFQLIWPFVFVATALRFGADLQRLTIGFLAWNLVLAVAGAVSLRRWQMVLLYPWVLAYDVAWRYFTIRGFVQAWRNPTERDATWVSPTRHASERDALPLPGTIRPASVRATVVQDGAGSSSE